MLVCNVVFCRVGHEIQSDKVTGVLAFFVLDDAVGMMMIMATNIEVVRSQKSVSSEEKLGGFLR